MINEYKNPSGHATAGHFHLSVGTSTEYSYFHFVKDANGKTLTGKGQDFDNKLAAIGGKGKIYQGGELDAVTVTANKPDQSDDIQITGTTDTYSSNDNEQMKTF